MTPKATSVYSVAFFCAWRAKHNRLRLGGRYHERELSQHCERYAKARNAWVSAQGATPWKTYKPRWPSTRRVLWVTGGEIKSRSVYPPYLHGS